MMINRLAINNIYKTIASMKINRFVKDLGCSIGKKLMCDAIIIESFVDIVNGDTVIHGKNSVVDQGLIGIINWLSGHTNNGYLPSLSWTGSPPSYSTYMVAGSDISYGTTNIMTALKTPIGTAPGTYPNTQSGQTSNPATGQWKVQWIATWNAGRLPAATLGEVGLYLYVLPTLQVFQGTASSGPYMFSRMSSADGKFTAFTINTAVPLSIAWTFQLTYAT